MKKLVFFHVTAILFLASNPAIAIPPPFEAIRTGSWLGGDTSEIYIGRAVIPGLPSADYWECVGISNPFDSLELVQAIQSYGTPASRTALYVIKFDEEECPTWARYDADTAFIPTERIVGYHPPWPDMANKITPGGTTL